MQELKSLKNLISFEKPGKQNIIWGSVCCVLLLTALIFGMYLYKDLPTSAWRESSTPLPWQDGHITIEKATSQWRSSKGNPRMELRALYYPIAHFTLGEGNGNGTLMIRFTDSDKVLRGGVISLPYRNGNFIPKSETNLQAAGKEAEVYVETGFTSEDDLKLHCLNESSPLWRVSVWNRPEGTDQESFLGYTCIPVSLP